jgi:hypothetical protein
MTHSALIQANFKKSKHQAAIEAAQSYESSDFVKRNVEVCFLPSIFLIRQFPSQFPLSLLLMAWLVLLR